MERNNDPIQRHDGLAPGEGPSADRYHPEQGGGGGPTQAPLQNESETLNQDGSRLGSMAAWGGVNPTGPMGRKLHDGEYEFPGPDVEIQGGETAILAEDGQRREEHPGIAGGPSPSDYGTSGWLGGDPSNVGMQGEEQI